LLFPDAEDYTMKYLRISLAATFALLLLAGCGSTLNDVLGTGTNTPTNTQSYSGNVNYIDFNAHRIDLNSNGYTTSVFWDSNTRFTYQNQNVNANSIRNGDYVTVQAFNNSNGQLLAQSVYDNGSGMASGTPPSSTSGSFRVQGTVSYVDTSAQRIDVSSAYVTGLNTGGSGQGSYSIYYTTSTPVYFQGNTYSPTNLERGDQVDISAYSNGGRYQADSITVTRNVRQ